MNRLQSLDADRDYLVTLNLTEAIDPAAVIRTIDYAHPVFTPEGVAAQRRWAEISRRPADPLLRRLLALGLPRGRRLVGAPGLRERSAAVAHCRRPVRRHRAAADPEPAAERAGGGRVTRSAIYEGWVAHRRFGPVPHSFRYRVFLPLFDLDELPDVLDPIPLWSARRPAPARFRAAITSGWRRPLAERARDLAQDRVGAPAGGPREAAGQSALPRRRVQPGLVPLPPWRRGRAVESVIAEVTNTPWGERTAYVLDGSAPRSGGT